MKIGVAREIKVHENRVALTPAGVDRLVAAGHEVLGRDAAPASGSGLADDGLRAGRARDRARRGARVRRDCDLVAQGEGAAGRRSGRCCAAGQTLFTYFHLAADRALTEAHDEDAARTASPTRRSRSTARCRC